jgi:hypothetical protein
MAKVNSGLGMGMEGSFGDLSIYRMKGVDKPVVRRKSGHTKEQIRTNPDLDVWNREGKEFGGASKASKYLRQALAHQKPLADHNIAGPLSGLMRQVQGLDATGEYGKRNVILSANPYYLKGFSLNKYVLFDSVVRYPINCTINRETVSAKVQIPALIPGISLVSQANYPYYSFCFSLGTVPDIIHNGRSYFPSNYAYGNSHYLVSEWYPLLQGSPAIELEVKYEHPMPDNSFTLIAAIGIRYGVLKGVNNIDQVPHAGSAKVLEVG